MIKFHYEIDFILTNEIAIQDWIRKLIFEENYTLGEINYIFCDDNYLLKINQEFLNHDTFTDIISFDYSLGKQISGDIYISKERVEENASIFKVSFDQELLRVIAHGVLHYCGYKDKSTEEQEIMRSKEDYYLGLY